MPKFYFTYGTDPAYPFQGGWTEVEAPDRPSACTAFKMYHPDASPLHPNCAGIYNEEQFQATEMYTKDNFGARCQEHITLSRKVHIPESEAPDED